MTSRMYSGVTMSCFTSTTCSPELVDPGSGFNCVSHEGRGAGALAPVAGLQAGTRTPTRRIPSKPNKDSGKRNKRLDIDVSPFLVVGASRRRATWRKWACHQGSVGTHGDTSFARVPAGRPRRIAVSWNIQGLLAW